MKELSAKAYLPNIHSPSDLKTLNEADMLLLAEEIRKSLVQTVSKTGGHLASNLGVVELTLAMHRVFDAPHDHIVFDVGHQSYVHKMLTGRYEQIETLRQPGGLSGFTKRSESEYDCFGCGHSSTSLSAALGFAASDKLNGSDAYTVAVIGDGAYTGGMIHEALNNCRKDLNLIIIMNENEMSISKNIGRFATHLSKIRTRSGYFKTKKATGAFLRRIPLIGKPIFRLLLACKKTLKNALYGSNYFESMGLTYLGPIDGNDYAEVENLLKEAKKLRESVVVHVKTKKGKGYAPAEEAPERYHGMSPIGGTPAKDQSFSLAMGTHLAELADQDSKICAITAAMSDGTGLNDFADRHPDRFFDVGIAEEHAVTFAAGLAANQMKPVVAVYATFLQRAYDSVVHDIALQNLPVVLCVDRTGLNALDGATHHGIFDVSFLSHIPNLKIYTPATRGALCAAMDEALTLNGPCAIRYPKGAESEAVRRAFYSDGEYGRAGARCNFVKDDAPHAVIVTHGRIVEEALAAAEELAREGVTVGIILLEYIKPYPEIAKVAADHLPPKTKILFLEEEIRSGGMGMNLSDEWMRHGIMRAEDFAILATEDSFVDERAVGQSIYDAAGVSKTHIANAIRALIK